MAAYTIRVELKGDPSYAEYEKLHAVMAQLGFFQSVWNGGKSYALPHATYYGDVQASGQDVLNAVQANVKKVQSNILIFVAKTETWLMAW